MFSVFLLSVALLGADDPPAVAATAARPALETYRDALAKAGKGADAHVRLALWCEAHGLTAERLKHLSLAVLYDPSNALARGLMGLVAYHGKWDRPDVIGQRIQSDPVRQTIVKEYLDRRARTPNTADAQMKLAAWCEENGLNEQTITHYSAVTRIDPSRDAAWKHLGYAKQGNRWVKPDLAAAARQDAARQKQADKHWKPILEKLQDGLASKDAATRARAEHRMIEVTDPRAVPMIWALFVRGNERLQIAAVQMLGQIDGPSASNGLAALAIFSPVGTVRGRAIETLIRRDPRDFVGRLVGLIRKPLKYEVRRLNGPGSAAELFVEGERYNVKRIYQNQTPTPVLTRLGGMTAPDVSFDPLGLQNLVLGGMIAPGGTLIAAGGGPSSFGSFPLSMTTSNAGQIGQAIASNPRDASALRLELESVRRANLDLQQRLAMDVQALEMTNAGINLLNDRTLPVLTATTGQDMGRDPDKWNAWWTDQLGYAYQSDVPDSKPTLTDFVNVSGPRLAHSCFAAGTLVQTTAGKRPIESIVVGDHVLSQNAVTGLLAFQPVLAVYRNKPSPTLRIAIDGETIIATGIHRFWKAGQGWTMARELKPGDRLRMVDGVNDVRSVEAEKTQPVFNMEVAENRDFFVGNKGVLVHDNSFVQPVLEPFDRQPELGSPVPLSK